MSPGAFAKMSIECFTLAQTFLPSNDSGKVKANISYSRATAILTANESTQLVQAIDDANTYVEQCPTVKVIKSKPNYHYIFSFKKCFKYNSARLYSYNQWKF